MFPRLNSISVFPPVNSWTDSQTISSKDLSPDHQEVCAVRCCRVLGVRISSSPTFVSVLTISSPDSVWNFETAIQLTSILYNVRRSRQTDATLGCISSATTNKRNFRLRGGSSSVSGMSNTSLNASEKVFPLNSSRFSK